MPPTYPLPRPIAAGQAGHASIHTVDRDAINDLHSRLVDFAGRLDSVEIQGVDSDNFMAEKTRDDDSEFTQAMRGRYAAADGTAIRTGVSVRVGSYNIRRADITTDIGVPGRQWADRKAAVAADALASGAKIIGLQEVYDSANPAGQGAELVAAMNAQLGQPGRWATTLRGANPTIYDTTVATLVAGGSTSRMLNPSIGQRYITGDRFTIGGRTITFASLHNHHQAETVGGVRRSITWLRAEALGETLAWLAEQPGPVILVGDFNNDRRTPLPQLRDAGVFAARDVAATVQRAEFPSTNAFSTTPTKVGRWLDHICATDDVVLETAGLVLTFAAGNDYPLKTPIPSDHQCAWADVTLTEGLSA
jgi:endonuclease/exonuclease/phosphatase family metal-dependent hydrolase